MIRAVNVIPLENYLLLIQFENNEKRVYNCLPLLKDELFSEIANINFFNTVHIDNMGIVCWDDSTDINPYELYDKSELYMQ